MNAKNPVARCKEIAKRSLIADRITIEGNDRSVKTPTVVKIDGHTVAKLDGVMVYDHTGAQPFRCQFLGADNPQTSIPTELFIEQVAWAIRRATEEPHVPVASW